jgi:hypothetical protein
MVSGEMLQKMRVGLRRVYDSQLSCLAQRSRTKELEGGRLLIAEWWEEENVYVRRQVHPAGEISDQNCSHSTQLIYSPSLLRPGPFTLALTLDAFRLIL